MSSIGDRWDTKRARLRERVARLVPPVLTNYPFEVLVGLVSILMGLPFLLGAVAPASLLALVGTFAFHAWAAALTLGGATVLVGLRLPARPNPTIVASGLQLSAGSFGVYAIAVLVILGLSGWTAFAAYGLLSILALVRAFHFRRIVDIQRGATRLKERRE